MTSAFRIISDLYSWPNQLGRRSLYVDLMYARQYSSKVALVGRVRISTPNWEDK